LYYFVIFVYYLKAAKSYALMEVLVTGTAPGIIKDQIPCFIEFVENPIYLSVEAEIKVCAILDLIF
jgi:hypothetical protein